MNALNDLRHNAMNLPLSDSQLRTALKERDASLSTKRQALAEDAARQLSAEMQIDVKEVEAQLEARVSLVAGLNNQFTQVERGERAEPSAEAAPVRIYASTEDYRKELDDIRAILKPFITPGYVQPVSADKLVHETVKRPISLSALQRAGALGETKEGLTILIRIGGSKAVSQQNDRPLGSFPRMNSLTELDDKDNVTSRLNAAQRLLRLYGLLMVEDGLLSP